MLVLSRKESERIRVGDSIVVTVVRLTKDRVRLGIEAPDDVLVLRDELEKDSEPVSSGMNRRSIAGPHGWGMPSKGRNPYSGNTETADCSVMIEEDPEVMERPMRRSPERPFPY